MKVASIQLAVPDNQSKEETIARAMSMMDQCRGCDLILLPEIWNIGFAAYDRYKSESEPIDGPTASAVAKKAKELGAWVFSGSFVEARDGKHYNTSILFDRRGEKIGQFSKVHLFTYQSREADILTRGDGPVVLDTEFGNMGLSTCYDLRFPELYRRMVDMGAEFLLVTSAWPFPRLEAWNMFNVARAHENTCFLISCNSTGIQSGMRFLGHSQVVDPWGNVVAGSGYLEGIVRAEIDPAEVARVRAEFPVLKDRVL